MKANLERLRQEIVTHLEKRGLVVFKSHPLNRDPASDLIHWDLAAAPDFREFAAAAEAAGVRIITVSALEFDTQAVEDAMEQLEFTTLDRDTRLSLEARLREFLAYAGFICEIELSFTHDAQTYVFTQPTSWYSELNELLDQIEDSFEPSAENPLGGYYSNN